MKCEWKKVPIKDLCIGIYDGPHATPPKSNSGAVFLGIPNFSNGRLDLSDIRYISEDDLPRWTKRVTPKAHDIVFSYEATLNLYAIIPEGFYGCLGRRMALMRPDESKVDYRFLYYYMFSTEWREEIERHKVNGSTVDRIPLVSFPSFTVNLPDMATQRYIADILSALDEKIEINNKINANLQQQAFCLFDQLLTKASGESVLISDIADLNPKRALTKNQIAKCIDMAQLSTTGAFPDGWVDKPFKGGMRFANGDTLLARITPCLENGKTAFIDFLNEGEVAFGSTEYIVLSPKEGIPPEFLYCLARYPAFVDYAVKNMNGSSGRQRVSAETIGQYSLPRLSDEQYQTFGELASPMFRKMKNNWMENMRLAEVRDALLPKLMSGELNLSDI